MYLIVLSRWKRLEVLCELVGCSQYIFKSKTVEPIHGIIGSWNSPRRNGI